MNLIKSQINQKINSMNENGKASCLFEIMDHCLQALPDLEAISLNAVGEQIEQLVSMVKYILIKGNESLKVMDRKQFDEIGKIQQKNNELEKQIDVQKSRLQVEQLNNQALKDCYKTLIQIDQLVNKMNIPEHDLITISNKFDHLSALSREMPELKSVHNKCKTQIDNFGNQLKKIITEKEECETLLRGKINEV